MGGLRPRTRLVKLRKAKKCPKCGKPLAANKVRCRRCHQLQPKIKA